LQNGAIPGGRIISNVGAGEYKPATSTINCTVSGTIHDSMDDILGKLHQAGLTLKAGCGIGYEFSTLRPKGDYVSGSGAHTSGPLSFMDNLRQDVLHDIFGRWTPRRTNGHLRYQSSRCTRFDPC
jgi:ribonucleoside-diphosphate reductase alpha chain